MRNPWRREALLGEDGTPCRHPNRLANLALIRNSLLRRLADKLEKHPPS